MIDFEKCIAYSDGKYHFLKELAVSILDLGFIHCDATYDVCHVRDGRFFQLEQHLDRFFASAAGMGLEIPLSRREIADVLNECVRRSDLRDAFVWMVCTRGIPLSGNPRDLASCKQRFLAYAKPYYGISVGNAARPVKITVSQRVRFPIVSMNPIFKSFHWGDLTAAQIEASQQAADTTVLVDLQGRITEGPGFNIFYVKDGVVCTPRNGMLEGITRKSLLTLCEELHMPYKLHNPLPEELYSADEVFLTSTSGGLTPVSHVDGVKIGTGTSGSVMQRLQTLYWDKHGDEKWTTAVRYG